MKKTYQNPETKVIKVQTALMTTVSMYGTNATGEAMSRRRGSDWEDDDEE